MTPRFPRSLRSRLALWNALALAGVLLLFSLAVYGLLARSLSAELDRSLAERAEQVKRAARRESRTGGGRPGAPRPNPFAAPDTYVQVASLDGRVLRKSENLGSESLPVTPAAAAPPRLRDGVYGTATVRGERVRTYGTRYVGSERRTTIVQVGRSLTDVERTLRRLRALAGAGLAVALGLSGLGVWFVTAGVLRPLRALTETAELVGERGDLSRRVPAPSSGDEVGRLGGAFNRMLSRLETSDQAVRAAHEEVREALEAQRRFVADASHELRTPLTTIRGNADLLVQQPHVTPEDRAAALAQIRGEAERMSRLVDDLLSLAHSDAGDRTVTAPVSLGPLLEDVVAQARSRAADRPIELRIDEPVHIDGDPDALRRLAVILLDNAIKYTRLGDRVTVRLRCGQGGAEIEVADTGPGIAPEDLPHVFGRFYRADKGRGAGGTGLGLAIAKGIAERHGGRIAASGAPGGGAVFTVWLPINPTGRGVGAFN